MNYDNDKDVPFPQNTYALTWRCPCVCGSFLEAALETGHLEKRRWVGCQGQALGCERDPHRCESPRILILVLYHEHTLFFKRKNLAN